jgi:hypothetical protein
MNSLTTSAHIEPSTQTLVKVFDGAHDGDRFVSLRIGDGPVQIALIAAPGSAEALRALAAAAEQAAQELDRMATPAAGLPAVVA